MPKCHYPECDKEGVFKLTFQYIGEQLVVEPNTLRNYYCGSLHALEHIAKVNELVAIATAEAQKVVDA